MYSNEQKSKAIISEIFCCPPPHTFFDNILGGVGDTYVIFVFRRLLETRQSFQTINPSTYFLSASLLASRSLKPIPAQPQPGSETCPIILSCRCFMAELQLQVANLKFIPINATRSETAFHLQNSRPDNSWIWKTEETFRESAGHTPCFPRGST